jgi:hypothetical protein
MSVSAQSPRGRDRPHRRQGNGRGLSHARGVAPQARAGNTRQTANVEQDVNFGASRVKLPLWTSP